MSKEKKAIPEIPQPQVGDAIKIDGRIYVVESVWTESRLGLFSISFTVTTETN